MAAGNKVAFYYWPGMNLAHQRPFHGGNLLNKLNREYFRIYIKSLNASSVSGYDLISPKFVKKNREYTLSLHKTFLLMR